jgi:hypothetical protein
MTASQRGVRVETMRITTWNVNSVRQRLDHLLTFLKEASPDVVCLQELKCLEEAFPRESVEAAGYNVTVLGQKAYNGVAILSKAPLEDVRRGLPGDDADEQARYLEGVVSTPSGVVRVASIYLPNGNPIGTPKFEFKIAWMDRLVAHAGSLLTLKSRWCSRWRSELIRSRATPDIRQIGRTDALYAAANPGHVPESFSISGSPTRCGPATTARRFSRSGTTKRALGSETMHPHRPPLLSPQRRTGSAARQ